MIYIDMTTASTAFEQDGFRTPPYFLPLSDGCTILLRKIQPYIGKFPLHFLMMKTDYDKYEQFQWIHTLADSKVTFMRFPEDAHDYYPRILGHDGITTPAQYYDLLERINPMKRHKLSDMTRGWFIGDFVPSVHRTNQFDVGVMTHKKGELWPSHVHSTLTEINVLLDGRMKVNNHILEKGQIITVEPGLLIKAIFLEDCRILCVKIPSVPNDKTIY